jgi:hypothetical protein
MSAIRVAQTWLRIMGKQVSLSLVLSCAVFWLVWGWRLPASETLHKWYWGFVAVFIAALMAMMVVAFRGRLERSAWPIVVGALLGYIAASLAYFIYFGLFELNLLVSAIRKLGAINVIVASVLLPPLATLGWLFGALSGAFFVSSRYLMIRGGYVCLSQ